jgi:hypothetical protein
MNNPDPERHYDLSAILGLADPLPKIQWPSLQLAEKQFLVACRDISPNQLCSILPNDVEVWEGLLQFTWWNRIIKSGIYLVTIPQHFDDHLPHFVEDIPLQEKIRLCKKDGAMLTPFVINVFLRLAHKKATGKYIDVPTLCAERTSSRSRVSIGWNWKTLALNCSDGWVNSKGYSGTAISSCKRIADLPP